MFKGRESKREPLQETKIDRICSIGTKNIMINEGMFLQVKTHFRTAITVPEKSWARFRDIFADYCERMRERGAGSNVGMNSGGGGNVLPEGRGAVVAQVPSPSTSQQPNPNPNLDSPLMK